MGPRHVLRWLGLWLTNYSLIRCEYLTSEWLMSYFCTKLSLSPLSLSPSLPRYLPTLRAEVIFLFVLIIFICLVYKRYRTCYARYRNGVVTLFIEPCLVMLIVDYLVFNIWEYIHQSVYLCTEENVKFNSMICIDLYKSFCSRDVW